MVDGHDIVGFEVLFQECAFVVCFHLYVDLISHNLKDGFANLYSVPFVLEPLDYSPFSHSAAKLGHEYFIRDRKSTRLNSSHVSISYAVFCLKKKTNN